MEMTWMGRISVQKSVAGWSRRPGQASKAGMSDKHQTLHSTSASLSQVLYSSGSFTKSTRLVLFSILSQNAPPRFLFPVSSLHVASQAPVFAPSFVSTTIHCSVVFSTANEVLVNHVCQVTPDFPNVDVEVKREAMRCPACPSATGRARMCIKVSLQKGCEKYLLRFVWASC
ncbi:uncharacterized protein M421DRAFT_186994 [Didymella exigua CBS 183.55]|uniref:Uncharacterized protein n=1 Tax=Didymella exigua CBS 183.55 TaxID=1150837 RepID=A0A6A5RIX3_9PLEO|nr:uncharacterized protein M421DRAFT_186994 [Didymella exigua CBS 183.55]KAF1926924.1 hypothetical protein M421DRAFT_186994 [Didymella exigua CBS 183.55]